jgi:hypothetical protein
MAFTHGKNAVFAIRDVNNIWRDLTPYLSEVNLPGKAGQADTTVFGKGAKTYIGGLLEGQMTMKGFFDPTASSGSPFWTAGPDVILASLLGTQPSTGLTVVAQVTEQSNYGQFILFPSGSASSIANIGALGDVVITDYSITAPVNNVVGFSASFNLSGATAASLLTFASGSQTVYSANTYGLQVIRGRVSEILSAGWLNASAPTGAAGATNYNNFGTGTPLIGSTL